MDANSNDEPSSPKEPEVAIEAEEVVLQYGDKTIHALTTALESSYKIFWDGAISNYSETKCSSRNNMTFL